MSAAAWHDRGMDPHLLRLDAERPMADKPFRSLCYAPFVQMSFSPNGDASACCNSRSYALGNVRKHRLHEIWNGERMAHVRAELRAYRFPQGCEFCAWTVRAGSTNAALRDFDDVFQGSAWPERLEFALSNTCNLACVMCTPDLSSTIRAKQGLPPLPPAYGDQFFDDLPPFLQHAKVLSFLGGEPFLQGECHRIWKTLQERDLPVLSHVTTNGTVFDARVESLLATLPFDLAISIDGVTQRTVESIRVNARFDRLMANVARFQAYVKGDTDRHASRRRDFLQFNFCVMQQNWHELADFFLWAESLDAQAWTTLVDNPPECSLLALPRAEVRRIADAIAGRADDVAKQLRRNRSRWLQVVDEIARHAEASDAASLQQIGASALANRASGPDELVSHMHRAWEHMASGERAEALAAARRVEPEDPHYFDACLMIGDIQTFADAFADAEAALQRALALTDRHPAVHMRLAWLRLRQGSVDDGMACVAAAEASAARVTKVEPWIRSGVHHVAARLAMLRGDVAAAAARVETWLRADPADGEALRLREELRGAPRA